MLFREPPLALGETRLRDALGAITLDDLPDPQPTNPIRLKDPTPLMERLWRIALSDVEKNIVRDGDSEYFRAGAAFGPTVYTRDISYAGVLALNRLYPAVLRKSLEHTRRVRLEMGFTVSRHHAIDGVDCRVVDLTEEEFKDRYHTNSYTRRTDDVVWLWAAEDLVARAGLTDDWEWLYETGKACFERLYEPFYDADDGLYRGQASFIDVHFADRKATGYPQEWSVNDCLRIQAGSTNCLYARGMHAMARAARALSRNGDAVDWAARAERLRDAIRRHLVREDGTVAYFRHPDGTLEPRREALSTAFAVLLDVLPSDRAAAAFLNYPVTDAGVPLIHPPLPTDEFYHNHSAWPFADTFFLWAREKATGVDETAHTGALLARTCRHDGTFHEVVDLRDKTIHGSGSQLWTAAAFLHTCLRAGWADMP